MLWFRKIHVISHTSRYSWRLMAPWSLVTFGFFNVLHFPECCGFNTKRFKQYQRWLLLVSVPIWKKGRFHQITPDDVTNIKAAFDAYKAWHWIDMTIYWYMFPNNPMVNCWHFVVVTCRFVCLSLPSFHLYCVLKIDMSCYRQKCGCSLICQS